ncbi:MAG TPA: hypothetical protein VHO23_02690 [Candidatus Paceibacterota bacterium]|nr:hypothetical protein [Candidatus Paceibacterota bacterium]
MFNVLAWTVRLLMGTLGIVLIIAIFAESLTPGSHRQLGVTDASMRQFLFFAGGFGFLSFFAFKERMRNDWFTTFFVAFMTAYLVGIMVAGFGVSSRGFFATIVLNAWLAFSALALLLTALMSDWTLRRAPAADEGDTPPGAIDTAATG